MKKLLIFILTLLVPTCSLPALSPFEALGIEKEAATGYEILGLSDAASQQELNKAYRKKSLQWHPDKNPGNEEATTPVFDLLKKAKEKPNTTFYADETKNAQIYHTDSGASFNAFGIEKPDVIRAVKVLIAGVALCVLFEVRSFIKHKKKNTKTVESKKTSTTQIAAA